MSVTNGYYHIVTTTGLAVQLPENAKPDQVTVEPNLTLHKTPYGTGFWLEGDGEDQPFTFSLSFLAYAETEDGVRAQIRQFIQAAQAGEKLVRDFSMELPIWPYIKRSFTATSKSTRWQVTLTFFPKQSQWQDTSTGLFYPF